MADVTTTSPTPPGHWGPDRRPAAVALAVDVTDDAPSPGAVAGVLDLFDRRRVPSTWFLPPGADPALLDRLWFTGHEAAAAVATVDDLAEAGTLASHGAPVLGVRLLDDGDATVADLARAARQAGLTHLSVPARAGGRVLVVDAPAGDRPVVVLGVGGAPDLVADPEAWLAAAQVGLGRAVQHRRLAVLRIDPVALDRSGALAVLVEAVDLAAGLARAERLHVDRLDRLVDDLVAIAEAGADGAAGDADDADDLRSEG
jgi:hypothetical protein